MHDVGLGDSHKYASKDYGDLFNSASSLSNGSSLSRRRPCGPEHLPVSSYQMTRDHQARTIAVLSVFTLLPAAFPATAAF